MSHGEVAVTETATMITPIGQLELVARAGAICEIRLTETADHGGAGGPAAAGDHAVDGPVAPGDDATGGPAAGVLDEARRQLAEYFDGRRQTFDLPTAAAGTAFQRLVWRELAGVGYGCTATYAELARAIGRPRAARAVGAALARNPLPLVVPCHRVIGAGGDLRGFGLGGTAVKRRLLDAETARLADGYVKGVTGRSWSSPSTIVSVRSFQKQSRSSILGHSGMGRG